MQARTDRTDASLPSLECILEDVRNLVAEQVALPVDKVEEKSHLINDLGYDSLDVIELMMEIEEHFEITVPDDLQEGPLTVAAIAAGVRQLLNGCKESA